jgi:hypothetical protein
VGDVNGDSLTDVLVSIANADGGRGAAELYLGRHGAAPERAIRFQGEMAGDAFGYAVGGGGDLNGDGWPDFVIGARQSDVRGLDSGRVYVWFGGPRLSPNPNLVLDEEGTRAYFGNWTACGGDVNGDGFDDIVVGAPLFEADGAATGRAYVYWGGRDMDAASDLVLTSGSSGSQFGVCAELADLNADGFAEVVVGSNWENTDAPHAGRVYIYLGGSKPDANADLILRGAYAQGLFGYPIVAVDLNNDAYTDLAVGEGGAEDGKPSRVRVYFGGDRLDAQPDVQLLGPTPGDLFGGALARAGDVNGDGLQDLLVAAAFQDEVLQNAGAAYVYFGGRELDAVADLEFFGDESWARFGWAMASLDDTEGDGFADLLIGAPRAQRAPRATLASSTCSTYGATLSRGHVPEMSGEAASRRRSPGRGPNQRT